MNSALAQGKDSFEYRYYLTNSGNAIEKQKLDELEQNVKCTSCTYDTVLPAILLIKAFFDMSPQNILIFPS